MHKDDKLTIFPRPILDHLEMQCAYCDRQHNTWQACYLGELQPTALLWQELFCLPQPLYLQERDH